MPSEEQEQDDLIDPLIDTTQVVMTHQRRTAFITDIARKIDEYGAIAMRYGFIDEADMAMHIRQNRELQRAIKEERAIWFSAENSEVRARELAKRGTIELLPDSIGIALNETITPSVRLDAVRTVARIAGLDGAPRGGAGYENAEGVGSRFTIQINIPGQKDAITITQPSPSIEHES